MRWARDADGVYHSGRFSIKKGLCMIWESSRPRKVVDWQLLFDGNEVKGYGTGYDTLAEAKARAKQIQNNEEFK